MMDRVNILGVEVHQVSKAQLIERVCAMATLPRLHRVYYVNAHCLNLAQEDPEYRRLLNRGDLVYCDGVGVRLASILLRRPLPERMTGTDWIDDLCSRISAEGLRVALVGGRLGVAEEAAVQLVSRNPGLKIAGTHHGYVEPDSPEEAYLLRWLRDERPDFLLVGMGPPRQEKWLDRVGPGLASPVGWCVGSLLDVLAGRAPLAPRWMSRHGLEWLFRLVMSPRSMAGRYLWGNPAFIVRVLVQMTRELSARHAGGVDP